MPDMQEEMKMNDGWQDEEGRPALPDELPADDELDDIEPVNDETRLYEHFRVVVDKGQEMLRVDKYLFDRLTNASRNRIQKAADAGFVMANGKPVKSSYKVKPGDVVTVMMDRPRYENEVIPEDIPLDIVYEDNCLMVVKRHSLASQRQSGL